MGLVHRASAVFTPAGVVRDHAVVVDAHGTITEVRPGRGGDPPALEGLLVPGLVNAHTHLELSWARGRVPGGHGLAAWVRQQLAVDRPDAQAVRSAAVRAAREAVEAGTAAVCDVSNGGDTGPVLGEAGLSGVVQHELLGFSPDTLARRVELARASARRVGSVAVRPSPHGVYSTPPELLVAAAAPRDGVPATIHVAEDAAEAQFLADGTGAFADLIDELGVDWRWWQPPGCSPVEHLHALDLLGPQLLCVHGVHLDDTDRGLLAAAGATVCLCPRSNLHIGGVLPDVAALVAAGIPLALGTDSLASCPDLDLLGEVAAGLRERPEVPADVWLRAATAGGADALGVPELGRLVVGARPGLLLLCGVHDPADLHTRPARRWLSRW